MFVGGRTGSGGEGKGEEGAGPKDDHGGYPGGVGSVRESVCFIWRQWGPSVGIWRRVGSVKPGET